MVGGVASFMGAWILGPRIGRWENPIEFEGHSATLQILGTFLLWFGWYGFNPGSVLLLNGYAYTMARVAVTTTLAGGTASVIGFFLKHHLPPALGGDGTYNLGHTCNSLLGGLVGITAGCATVPVWASLIIGCVAAFAYHGGSCLMRQLRIDDPLDAFAVHGCCGAWGVIAAGIFTAKEYSYAPHPANPQFFDANGTEVGFDSGLFMEKTRGVLFGTQVIGVIAIVAWTATTSGILFGILKAAGMLRVQREVEEAGADVSKHGGYAYPEQMAGGNRNPHTKSMNNNDSAS